MKNISTQNYILGLDLGIASVGWSVVGIDEEEMPTGLIDCGVRTFEKAEVPKTGESLAAARRLARSSRRLIRRRAHRLLRLRRLLKRHNVLAPDDFDENGWIKNLPVNVWDLRVDALDRKLSPLEWAAVLHHIVKHRGYLSVRKSEKLNADKETGKLLQGVANNSAALQSGQFRTPAELAVKQFVEDTGHIRNQAGDYTHTFDRHDLASELTQLFASQRAMGNLFATPEIEEAVLSLLMTQRAALSGEAILRMLGKCTFETDEYKAPKATYSAERFV